MQSFTASSEIGFSIALYIPLETLIMLRDTPVIKDVIKDNNFWRKRIEAQYGIELSIDMIAKSWYSVYIHIENNTPEELLYFSEPDVIRLVFYLNKLGIINVDPSRGYHKFSISSSTPLDKASRDCNEEVIRVFLQDPRVSPYSQYSWAFSNVVTYCGGQRAINILKLFLDIDDEDYYHKINAGLFEIFRSHVSTEITKLLLDDPRSNPNKLNIEKIAISSLDKARLLLNDDRIDKIYSIGRLFFISGIYDQPEFAKLALEYDRKERVKIINHKIYFETIKVACEKGYINTVLYLLQGVSSGRFILSQEEYDELITATMDVPKHEKQVIIILKKWKAISKNPLQKQQPQKQSNQPESTTWASVVKK
jgi:hypothetical protein